MSWRAPWEGGKGAPVHAPIPPPLHPTYDLEQVIAAALEEDSAGIGDVTSLSTIPAERQAVGVFKAKADGVLAGLAVVDQVFEAVDPSVTIQWQGKDGDFVLAGTVFGEVRGSARSLLTGERVALNFLQRMSGIATATHAMCEEIKPHSSRILETRKTAPGLRLLDKWAVLIGGGCNHRMGLFDMAMIKNNHIAAAGGLVKALQACQAYLREKSLDVPIEVEVRSLEEARQLADLLDGPEACPVARVMLDNMARAAPHQPGGVDVSMMQEAQQIFGSRVQTEASGNVSLATVKAIAATGVDFISCGALTHSVAAMDISLHLSEHDPTGPS